MWNAVIAASPVMGTVCVIAASPVISPSGVAQNDVQCANDAEGQ